LDFGLAKLNPKSADEATVTAEATVGPVDFALATPGMVMGTAPYMSPEQVRGNPHNPDWCYLPFFCNHYRKGEYEAALQALKKINMP
jgi:serine/threonine protein kinase